METQQQHPPTVMQIITLVFMSLAGDVLMTLDVFKEDKWSTIIEMIVTEEWYQTCKRWKFFFGLKNLNLDDVLDDVLDSDEDQINITCVKIDPQIIFELSSGEFLVSVSFDQCVVWGYVSANNRRQRSAAHEQYPKSACAHVEGHCPFVG